MNEFYDDLAELQNKYPSCYIEAWTPEDFVKIIKKEESEINWNDYIPVAQKLYDTFDGNQGTNWHKVFHIVEGSPCNH
jgi:hypothetical protein